MQTYRNQIKVTNWRFNEEETAIIATAHLNGVTIESIIVRSHFEEFFTNGTDEYEYTMPVFEGNEHVNDAILKAPITEFYNESKGAICSELWAFLVRTDDAYSSLYADFCHANMFAHLRRVENYDLHNELIDAVTKYGIAMLYKGSDSTARIYSSMTAYPLKGSTITIERTPDCKHLRRWTEMPS